MGWGGRGGVDGVGWKGWGGVEGVGWKGWDGVGWKGFIDQIICNYASIIPYKLFWKKKIIHQSLGTGDGSQGSAHRLIELPNTSSGGR